LCRGIQSHGSLQAHFLFGFFVAGTLAPVALTGADFYTGWAAGLFFPIKVVLLLSLLFLASTDGCLAGFAGKAGLAISFDLDLERPLTAGSFAAGFRTGIALFFRRGETAFFSVTGTV